MMLCRFYSFRSTLVENGSTNLRTLRLTDQHGSAIRWPGPDLLELFMAHQMRLSGHSSVTCHSSRAKFMSISESAGCPRSVAAAAYTKSHIEGQCLLLIGFRRFPPTLGIIASHNQSPEPATRQWPSSNSTNPQRGYCYVSPGKSLGGQRFVLPVTRIVRRNNLSTYVIHGLEYIQALQRLRDVLG